MKALYIYLSKYRVIGTLDVMDLIQRSRDLMWYSRMEQIGQNYRDFEEELAIALFDACIQRFCFFVQNIPIILVQQEAECS